MLENLLRYKLWKEIIGDIIATCIVLIPILCIVFILILNKINEYKYNKELLHRNRKNHPKTIGVFDSATIKDTTKIIDFLKHEFPRGVQMFWTQGISDDYMYKMYSNDDVKIFSCCQYHYIEILGLTTNEFNTVCKAVNKHHMLKRKFSD